MTEDKHDLHAHLSRREFLSMATAGVTLAMAGRPENLSLAATNTHSPAAETLSLDTGGIAMEHFEAARKRAATIVAKMTLKEKITQFGTAAPAIPRLNIRAFNYYVSEALHGLIHDGPVTAFPLPLAMGCCWNRSLIKEVFTAVSDEIWAWHKKSGEGLTMFSPPTVNMGTRDPRWGRIGENYSEDPYLVGEMAVYTIHGMQGNDPKYLKTTACAKHFIANDTEDDRHSTSATVDPRSFWEYYTRGFEACVRDGHVFTVMSSYNAMNGIPTTASRFLLTDVLRKRWGFRGYVVSDCMAIYNICHNHHFVPTDAEAAALAVNAGCDICCGHTRTLQRFLGQAVEEMLISESVLDQSLIRSFTGRVVLGEFDPQDQIPYDKISVSCLESPAHQALAREMALQSIVLFKNQDNALPLDKSKLKKVAVIGPMADTCHLGNYSGKPEFRVSPLQGIKKHLGYMGSSLATSGTTQVTYSMGCGVLSTKDEARFAEAMNVAKEADVALVFVGADQQIDSEANDRDYLHLPGVQHELVQAVYAANPRTILVISSNCPVAVNWEQEHLPAIVGGMFLGEQQGNALADVLFGDYNPGGKTSTTWYRRVEDLPDFHDYNIREGRTYMYFQGDPLYPFGHGLSYTMFAYKSLRLSSKTLSPGGKITFAVDVTNTGWREGDEIVQAYVRVNAGTVTRPKKQLIGFDRIHLKPGETRTATLDLTYDNQALCYWDEERYEFVVDPGSVDLMIGASSADIRLKEELHLISD